MEKMYNPQFRERRSRADRMRPWDLEVIEMHGDRDCLGSIQSLLALLFLLTLLTTGCGSVSAGPSVTATHNPLVAQYNVSLGGPAQVWVEFGPDTNYGRQTSQYSANGIGVNVANILVAGMKPSTTYHMRAHAKFSDGSTWVDQDRTFTTGSPFAVQNGTSNPGSNGQLHLPTISVSTPTVQGVTPSPGLELLSLTAPPGPSMVLDLVTDINGNVVWYCNSGATPIKLLPNGHFILNVGSDLLEVDLACNTIRDVTAAQVNQSLQANGYDFTIPPDLGVLGGAQFHHDMLVLPNGHWIGLCEVAKSFTDLTGYPGTTKVVGDALVDIDPTGNVTWAWSSFDHLDVNRHPYFGLPDWTHSNAIVYTPDGDLLLSMRAQSWILKIDYANGTGTGDILWKLGEGGDFTLAGGDPSQWFYAQHYPNLLSVDGSLLTLAVYDDGNYRTYSDGTMCGSSASAPACYSRGAIFQLDESTDLATLLWQDLPGLYSVWGGSIGVLNNGDVEFDNTDVNGTSAEILEVTHTANPQIVWQMNIAGAWAYRGFRIPSLYPGVTWTQ